jgi:hypothetical protein
MGAGLSRSLGTFRLCRAVKVSGSSEVHTRDAEVEGCTVASGERSKSMQVASSKLSHWQRNNSRGRGMEGIWSSPSGVVQLGAAGSSRTGRGEGANARSLIEGRGLTQKEDEVVD